jgi:drug/metabolite transporter (DMT)-like permease
MNAVHQGTDHPALGILLMIAGVVSFAVMDATIKWLSSDFAITQIVALRSWFGLPLLFFLVYLEGGIPALKTNRPGAHWFRYLLVFALSFSFFWVLSRMKLVDAIAITFAAPILITALSVPVLKEAVGLHRWFAILVGFVGVLLMLRPGAGVFQWAAVVALGSTTVYAFLMITTRALKSTETTAALMFYPQFGMALTGLFLAPLFWKTPDLKQLGLFAIAGTFGSLGILFLTNAFRLAPVATVSPFEYTALIWATLFGYLLWQELPDSFTLFGASIVIASGLYILYRETMKTGQFQPKLPGMSPDDTGQ